MRLAPLLFALPLATAHLPAAFADGQTHTYGEKQMDEAKARRALAEIPGSKMDDVWFATGLEDYYKSPACIIGRNIYVFTKPSFVVPGLYRGKRTYINQDDTGTAGAFVCNKLKIGHHGFTADTASFIPPEDIHPDESLDGNEPGLFQVDAKVTDKELLALAPVIQQVQACLKDAKSCPFKLDNDIKFTKDHVLIPAIKTKNLTLMGLKTDPTTGKEYYELFFTEEPPQFGAIAMDIYYRNEAVTKVSMTDEVLE